MSYWYYRRKSAKSVKNGFKAKNRRGAFGETWVGKNWIRPLEASIESNRRGRARTYVRKGQIADIKIGIGKVRAKVQGSRSTPYKIVINLKPLKEKTWDQLIQNIARNTEITIQLLKDNFPEELEEDFADFAIFPNRISMPSTKCSCPDSSNPCKHIGALFYALTELIDEDPFIILILKGIKKENFIEKLRDEHSNLKQIKSGETIGTQSLDEMQKEEATKIKRFREIFDQELAIEKKRENMTNERIVHNFYTNTESTYKILNWGFPNEPYNALGDRLWRKELPRSWIGEFKSDMEEVKNITTGLTTDLFAQINPETIPISKVDHSRNFDLVQGIKQTVAKDRDRSNRQKWEEELKKIRRVGDKYASVLINYNITSAKELAEISREKKSELQFEIGKKLTKKIIRNAQNEVKRQKEEKRKKQSKGKQNKEIIHQTINQTIVSEKKDNIETIKAKNLADEKSTQTKQEVDKPEQNDKSKEESRQNQIDELMEVKGIGNKYAQILVDNDIETIEDLVYMSLFKFRQIKEISAGKLTSLIDNATKVIFSDEEYSELINVNEDHLGSHQSKSQMINSLQEVNGVGEKYAETLVKYNLWNMEDLANMPFLLKLELKEDFSMTQIDKIVSNAQWQLSKKTQKGEKGEKGEKGAIEHKLPLSMRIKINPSKTSNHSISDNKDKQGDAGDHRTKQSSTEVSAKEDSEQNLESFGINFASMDRQDIPVDQRENLEHLKNLTGIGNRTVESLKEMGIDDIFELATLSINELTNSTYPNKTMFKFQKQAQKYITGILDQE